MYAFPTFFYNVVFSNPESLKEIICVVEGGFRRVRIALDGCEELTPMHSVATDRLFVSYNELIPKIVVSIASPIYAYDKSLIYP